MDTPTNTRAMRKAADHQEREFLCWDGEGMNLSGDDKAQHYVLFGNCTGAYITGEKLGTRELLEFIVSEGIRNPNAIHVGFYFNYDVNMILRDIPRWKAQQLSERGYCWLYGKPKEAGAIRITWRRNKQFVVTKNLRNNPNKVKGIDYASVTIYDVSAFFQSSFVKVISKYLPDEDITFLTQGKNARGGFQWEDMPFVLDYWKREIALMHKLMNTFRPIIYGADFRIKQWHGPGVLANFVFNKNSTKLAMDQNLKEEIQVAAQYAYAGGRFELFKLGRHEGPLWALDINSAYPFAISQLPDLSRGSWQYVTEVTEPKKFAVYHLRFRYKNARGLGRAPGPLFFRTDKHEILYPHAVEGWYWGPEVVNVLSMKSQCEFEIIEGWEFDGTTLAFPWVAKMYDTRLEWKAAGKPQEHALKLALNSLYGKMAQRVGWDRKHKTSPTWHQLEWAGWITSYTRFLLFQKMRELGLDTIISVETDGIYTTRNPAEVGITNSTALGGWSVKEYDEIIYLQSGLYFIHGAEKGWEAKTRGVPPKELPLSKVQDYISSLKADEKWPPLVIRKTNFITLGQALMNTSADWRDKWCRWITDDHEIQPGEKGKRVHLKMKCRACAENKGFADGLHDMVIAPNIGGMSTLHSLPWKADNPDSGDVADYEIQWRIMAKLESEGFL